MYSIIIISMVSKKYIVIMLLLFILIIYFLSNSRTMVCKNLFIVDPSYMQNIKQLRDRAPSVGLYDLSLYMSVQQNQSA